MNTNEGMTIRQIAELCGVDERTVQRWVSDLGDKMPSVTDKMSSSSPMYPAKFSLEEVLVIIRSGGRATLADLLSDNAARTAALPVPVNQSAIEAQNSAVGIYRELISQQKALIQNQAIAIDFLTREIQNLRRTNAARVVSGLLPEGTEDGEWITTTDLSAIYGKTRATTLSHARARGWPMRSGQIESGSFTFEFLVSGLPEKLQDAWKAHKEAADAQ